MTPKTPKARRMWAHACDLEGPPDETLTLSIVRRYKTDQPVRVIRDSDLPAMVEAAANKIATMRAWHYPDHSSDAIAREVAKCFGLAPGGRGRGRT